MTKKRHEEDKRPRISGPLFNKITNRGTLTFEDQVQKIYNFYIKKRKTTEITSDCDSDREHEDTCDGKKNKRGRPPTALKNAEKSTTAKKPKKCTETVDSESTCPALEKESPFLLKIQSLSEEMIRVQKEMAKLQNRNETLNAEVCTLKGKYERACGKYLTVLNDSELEDLLKVLDEGIRKIKEEISIRMQLPFLSDTIEPVFSELNLSSLPHPKQSHLCILCGMNERSVAFLPCHHMPLCSSCLQNPSTNLQRCHSCNEEIECTLQIKP